MLIFVYLSMHEWGAEYKYSDVPLGEWMKPWLHTSRNHYDRVMHFSLRSVAGISDAGMVYARGGRDQPLALSVAGESTLAFSACYEMLEAFAASVLTPERGEEFVGECRATSGIAERLRSWPVYAIAAMILIAAVRTARESAAKEMAW